MGGNFKFQVQDRFLLYIYFFFGGGYLKNELHFLKKNPKVIRTYKTFEWDFLSSKHKYLRNPLAKCQNNLSDFL